MSLPNVTISAGVFDVAPWAFEVRVDRGRGRELDPPSAGIAEFYLRNSSGFWNPGNTAGTVTAGTATASPPSDLLAPGTKLAVACDNGTVDGSTLFYGRIRSAEYSYDVSGDAVVRVLAEDALGGLARRTLDGFSHDVVTYGSAVRAVLDNTGYIDEISVIGTALPSLEPGIVSGASTIAPYGAAESQGVEALDYLAALEASEQGRIFCTRDGFFSADGRYATGPRSVGTAITFTDDEASSATYPVRYQTITGRSGGDVLYTRVTGYSQATDSWRTVTAAGTATYGLSADLSMSNLRLSSDSQVDGVIGLLAVTYDSPEWRVQSLSCKPFASLAAGTALKLLLDTELEDTVTVEFTPTAGSAIAEAFVVQGVRHSITPGDHTMALDLSVKQFDRGDFIVLGTSTLGTAGTDVLGF